MSEVKYIDRKSGNVVVEQPPGAAFLRFLYNNPFGRLTTYLLFKRKFVSAVGGWYMNRKSSSKKIDGFVDTHKMDLSQYIIPEEGFRTFNDFFYRKVKKENRPIGEGLVSPADGKVLAFQNISDSKKFFVKGTEFKLSEFLNSEELASQFEGGGMIIIRLAPTDYHRYHFPFAGHAGPSIKVKGDYFSVSPIALRKSLNIFLQNKREYTNLSTKSNGNVIICDVGATMVGGIVQTYDFGSHVEKGQEKGYFAFGGSTLLVLVEKGKFQFAEDILKNTAEGNETAVIMGETLGVPL